MSEFSGKAHKRDEFIDIPGLIGAAGSVRLPGSKSISNRVLLLATLCDGVTEVRDLLASDDTARMLDSLARLGVGIDDLGDNAYRVHGCGGRFPNFKADLFLGNAGTAIRPLTAALAVSAARHGGEYTLDGVARMHERPIGDLVDALRELGADVRYIGKDGFPPLAIGGGRKLDASMIKVRGDVSSQFLTALLMALPLTGERVEIEVVGELISKPYIEITLATLARFGVVVERQDWSRFTIPGSSVYRSPGTIYVEGDASSASYFLAAGALGGSVRVEGVGAGSIQGDVRFAEALEKMGARIEMGANWIEASPPADGCLRAITLDCNHIPDAAMTLVIAALFADGTTTLTNIASWRVKETDRIAAMAVELAKIGAIVEEGADFLRITPPAGGLAGLRPAAIDTYDDHRMAMCFSLVALSGCPVRIYDPNCVAKTFPDYFASFAAVTRVAPVIAIDGPSASGKGTVAARVAAVLGFHYLDSGAIYRLTALAAQRAGVAWNDETAVAAVAETLDAEFSGETVFLAGEDVSQAIRSEAMSSGASQVAALPAVRSALLFRQRAFRCAPGLVGDGRDMGSVVFPDAPLKVFLTASVEARAERRYKQLMAKGNTVILSVLLQDLRERDERDSQRAVAPLAQGAEAKLLDTTQLSIDDAVAQVLAWYERHWAGSAKGKPVA